MSLIDKTIVFQLTGDKDHKGKVIDKIRVPSYGSGSAVDNYLVVDDMKQAHLVPPLNIKTVEE